MRLTSDANTRISSIVLFCHHSCVADIVAVSLASLQKVKGGFAAEMLALLDELRLFPVFLNYLSAVQKKRKEKKLLC